MSTTKRSARLASREPSPQVAATPVRRSTRKAASSVGNPPDTIPTRESTSYGSGFAVDLPQESRRGVQPLDGILENIMEVVPEEPELPEALARGGRRRPATPARVRGGTNPANYSRHFEDESDVFGNATFFGASNAQQAPVKPIAQEVGVDPVDMARAQREALQLREKSMVTRFMERTNVRLRNSILDSYEFIKSAPGTIWTFVRHLFDWLHAHWGWLLLLVTFIFSVQPFLDLDTLNSTNVAHRMPTLDFGPHFRNAVNSFSPWKFSVPDASDPGAVRNLQQRMHQAEQDISWLKNRNTLDPKAIEQLEAHLPDFVVFKKNKLGEKEIPLEFWQALKHKIESDIDHLHLSDTGTIDAGGLTSHDIKKIARSEWDEYMERNEARLKAMQGGEINDVWAEHVKSAFKDEERVPKLELVKMLRMSFQESKAYLDSELGRISMKVDEAIREREGIHRKQPTPVTEEKVRGLIDISLRKLIPTAQLEALAKHKIRANINQGLRRVNFFSRGAGAIISPIDTSPTYPTNDMLVSRFKRAYLWLTWHDVPLPNKPVEAISKWDEQGDCWCAPADSSTAASLAVLIPKAIRPDEIVVEHIPSEASLEPGSIPRQMELLAEVEGWNNVGSISSFSQQLFPDHDHHGLDDKWIMIGSFKYDRNSPENIQAFPVQLNLADFGADARYFLVRALDNWGGSNHTCFYRVRLHGVETGKLS